MNGENGHCHDAENHCNALGKEKTEGVEVDDDDDDDDDMLW